MLRRLIFLIVLSQALTFGQREVKHAAVLFRHGDRMPIDCYPKDPYRNSSFWPAPFGQLTNVGKKQHFMLGRFLRQRYAHLLSEFYDPKELFVQSTDVDRTLMSAEANLAGMFPPIGKEVWDEHVPWQPIPVHTVPERLDEIIAMKRHCPRYGNELEAYIASPPYLRKLDKYKHFMDYLSNNTGIEVKDFTDVMLIYSCLNIESLYNFTLPDWTKKVYPEPLHQAAGISFSVSAATRPMARLIAGPLVQRVVRAMGDVVRGRAARRLMMYSGHDFTVGTVLTALGLYDGVCPQYTATVFFELVSDKNATTPESEWFVRVLYRNTVDIVEPTPLAVPGCGELCPFSEFVRIYDHLITVDWDRECAVVNSSGQQLVVLYLASVVAGCVALAVLWAMACIYSRKRTKHVMTMPIEVYRSHLRTCDDLKTKLLCTPAAGLSSPATPAHRLMVLSPLDSSYSEVAHPRLLVCYWQYGGFCYPIPRIAVAFDPLLPRRV